MLRRRPNIAAAMESSTSRVSTWTSSVPPLIGVMRMPASAARAPPRAQENAASRSGRPPLSWRSAGVVDHGPHGHAGAGAGEQQTDAHGDEHTAAQGDRLVVGDVDAEELELRRVAEEQAVGARHAGAPDPLRQRDQPQHDADGDDDFGHVSRLAQPPHDPDVEDDAQQGSQHDEHGEERERRRPVPAVAELPVGECRQHRHGALGEVEDARGRVGQDETGGRDPVDGAGDQPEDRVGEEQVHGRSSRRSGQAAGELMFGALTPEA